MDFEFSLARPDDDPAIRRLLRENPVPGAIPMTFEREPDYFMGCGPMGRVCQVVVARHLPTGAVAGVACRAARPLFVNGQEQLVGYIGELRVDPRFRGRWLVSRGARFLHDLHGDGLVPGYLATITEGNREALGVLLERRRGHMPSLQAVSRLTTLAFVLRRRHFPAGLSRATATDLPEVVAFLRAEGRRRQFFPAYTEADFAPGASTTLGFAMTDMLLARSSDGRILGCLGLWDQSAYKQSVVQGYTGALRWARPVLNAGARLAGFRRPLPDPGSPLRVAYASFCCVAGDNPAVFRTLLEGVQSVAAERGFAFLTVGLFEHDPLLAVARRYIHIPYHSRLYTVAWDTGGSFHARHDSRLPYLDVATL